MVKYFSKIWRPPLQKIPKLDDTLSKTQKLFSYYGLTHSSSVGLFTIMPMLHRSLDKLIYLIDSHMSKIDAEKLSMPSLCRSTLWKKSGRWDKMTEDLIKFKLRDSDMLLQPTHEEEITNLLKNHHIKRSQFPLLFYQITSKFRNEKGPKHGLLRTREFLMKDLYSFHINESSAYSTYEKVLEQYHNIFHDLNIPFSCVEANSGAMGGNLSHEFQVCSPIGEDVLLKCSNCGVAKSLDLKFDESNKCSVAECNGSLTTTNSIEIGHCFMLGQEYSSLWNLDFSIDKDSQKPLHMNCFGIGMTRLLATCAEVLTKGNNLRWPRMLAPFHVAICLQKPGAIDEPTNETKDDIINKMQSVFVKNHRSSDDIVIDDIDVTIGSKINYANALGIPWTVVIKNCTTVELIDNYSGCTNYVHLESIFDIICNDEQFYINDKEKIVN